MSRPFLEQLKQFIDDKDFPELEKCEFKVAEMLRNYGRVVEEMESNEDSWLNTDPFALAVKAELKKLKTLVKKVDKLYKAKAKEEKNGISTA